MFDMPRLVGSTINIPEMYPPDEYADCKEPIQFIIQDIHTNLVGWAMESGKTPNLYYRTRRNFYKIHAPYESMVVSIYIYNKEIDECVMTGATKDWVRPIGEFFLLYGGTLSKAINLFLNNRE